MTEPATHPLVGPLIEQDLIRPLSARSLIASTLLGSHPPRLRGPLLVAFGEAFGIPSGTVRVALSRMVDRGELTNDDGTYGLTGGLLTRQTRQDRGRSHPTDVEWNGDWVQAVVVVAGRSSADRARLRAALTGLGLAERREGVWLRPDNLGVLAETVGLDADLAAQVEWYVVRPTTDATALVADLFDVDGWARTARALIEAVTGTTEALHDDPTLPMPVPFHVAAAALRHLGNDPLLPAALLPSDWPGADLRDAYNRLDAVHGRHLRAFFAAV